MKFRRRTPLIFSLSLVDMLCCALGCLIFLWLVNSRAAHRKSTEAHRITQQLQRTLGVLESTQAKYSNNLSSLSQAETAVKKLQGDLQTLRGQKQALLARLSQKDVDLDELSRRMLAASQEMDRLEKASREGAEEIARQKRLLEDKDRKLTHLTEEAGRLTEQLAGSLRQMSVLDVKFKKADGDSKNLSGQFASAQEAIKDLKTRLASADKRASDASGQTGLSDQRIKELTGQLQKFDKQVKNLNAQLDDSDKLARKLQALVDALKLESRDVAQKLVGSETANLTLGQKLDKSQASVAAMTRQLNDLLEQKKVLQVQLNLSEQKLGTAGLAITGLKADKLDLLKQKNLAQAAIANRFAGINLTGKRVIFLVDISGSMGMTDPKTQNAAKWPKVCESLGKVLSSLPEVTHYQVIVFSEGVWYPLARPGQWLEFDPRTSPKTMVDAMKRIQPKGGTRMRRAFAEAFRFRDLGLDTIYLVSDGLPNDDDDLPAEVAKLQGVERTAYLTQQIRQLLKTVWNRPVNNRLPVRINAIGFYFDSPEVGAFLWALARENDGGFVGMSGP